MRSSCCCPHPNAQTRDIGVHGEMLDRIAAIVNDGLVLRAGFDVRSLRCRSACRSSGSICPRKRAAAQQVLDRLVVQEIQLQRAKHVGLTVPMNN